jgi:hypothetical protein
MPRKYQPDLVYLRHVRLSRVHLFTAIQVVCLVILFVLKSYKAVSIVLPLMVVSLLFVRYGLNYVFTQKELSFLDDALPGMGEKRKRQMSLKEIDLEVLERAAKNHVTSLKRRNKNLSEQLMTSNAEISEEIESEKN